ncbi:MAG: iron-sulfur cluster assembly scaffold protein [Minisyncoccia bacterium]
MQLYSKKVIEHFTHPKNMGVIKKPSGVGIVGNPICGDIMKIYIKVDKNKKGEEFIKDIKFQTLGCGAAIATSSMVTELVKGKTIKEAIKISNRQNITKKLDGLPPSKLHCSLLADRALKKAIANYRKKKNEIK